MPRFYFDLTDGQQVIDDVEGREADSFDQALAQARSAVEEMRADGELEDCEYGWRLLIRDEKGSVLTTIAAS